MASHLRRPMMLRHNVERLRIILLGFLFALISEMVVMLLLLLLSYSYCCLILIVSLCILIVVYVFILLSMYS